jgi:serine/threonine-protein kinase
VLSTDPASGTKVSKHSHIKLVVSGGPTITTVTVPPVVGQQFTAAAEALDAVGLSFKPSYDNNSNRPTGTVLSESPSGNTKTKSTTVVKLVVSGTKSSVQVPNVVGDSPAAAGSALASDNLTLGSQTNMCSTQPDGVVASQSPTAGTPEPQSTPVNLVISSGSCATVPAVVGLTQDAASAAVTGANLQPVFSTDTDCAGGTAVPGNVDSQTPAAQSQVDPNSTVTMTVCQPTSSTSTTTTPGGGGTTTTTTSGGLL